MRHLPPQPLADIGLTITLQPTKRAYFAPYDKKERHPIRMPLIAVVVCSLDSGLVDFATDLLGSRLDDERAETTEIDILSLGGISEVEAD